MRKRQKVLKTVVSSLLLVLTISLGSLAQATASRSISPDSVLPGGTFRVTVSVTANQSIMGLGLDENVPSGWSVSPVNNGGGTYSSSETAWLWLTANAGDTKTVSYDVTVPAGTTPGSYSITGVVKSGSPAFSYTVGGEHSVMVLAPRYTLTIAVSGSGSTSPSVGTHTYAAGTVVQLTATPAAGWRFDHWSGSVSGSRNPRSITMNGNKSVTAHFVKVNQSPVASFAWYTLSPEGVRLIVEPRRGDNVQFDASASRDPDGEIVKYAWDWDSDGTYDATSTDPVIGHVFTVPGKHQVTLQVTDDKGGTAEVTKTLTIGEKQPPGASFTFSPTSPSILDTVQFTDESSDSDGQIMAWEWNFGDGTTSTEKNPKHRYTRKGTFTVKLNVTDNDGLTSTTEKEIEVVNVPPRASFTFKPKEPYAGQEVVFDASGSEDPDGKIVKYSWDFGDGETAEGIEVTHVFEKPGTYTVELTVTDDDGATVPHVGTVEVKPPPTPVKPKGVWGLIIGISDYEKEGLDLGCARADAEALREVFVGAGVPEDHLRLLADEEATLVAVREGLGWLMRNAGGNDLVIFYFSGHGYQGLDMKPKDEGDGLDEYFVLYDTEKDSIEATALRDDEFGQFLDEIASEHVLVIFDSCYSGGLPKGQRGLPPGGKPKGPLDFFNDFDPKGKLVLAASAEDQLSWEDRGLDHGVFTHFLLEGLKGKADANGDYWVTVEELYEYVDEEVPKYVRKKFHAEQEPQLLGKGSPRVEVGAKDRPPEAAFSWEPEAPYVLGEVRFLDASSDDHGVVSWSWDFGDGAASSERNPAHVYAEEGSYRVVLVVMDTAGQKARVERELEVGPPGEVTAVDERQGLVTISLGARQGVKVGDRFQVFAYIPVPQGTPLKEVHGVIEVVYLAGPDRAVCRTVERLFPIKVKDKVRPIGGR